jgi:DNA-nicking Smr family endonuclease
MRKKTPERGLSREDEALWRHVAGTVKPLAKVDRPKPAVAPAPPPIPPKTIPPLVPKAAAPPPELAPGLTPGLDRRTAQRLKKGDIPVEASLDLHGLSQEEAHRALARFLARAAASGRRCVLVVTGKGGKGGEGVLRANVPRWLNEPELRAQVLAFVHAAPKDGDTGALYVLLKRRRDTRTRPQR